MEPLGERELLAFARLQQSADFRTVLDWMRRGLDGYARALRVREPSGFDAGAASVLSTVLDESEDAANQLIRLEQAREADRLQVGGM